MSNENFRILLEIASDYIENLGDDVPIPFPEFVEGFPACQWLPQEKRVEAWLLSVFKPHEKFEALLTAVRSFTGSPHSLNLFEFFVNMESSQKQAGKDVLPRFTFLKKDSSLSQEVRKAQAALLRNPLFDRYSDNYTFLGSVSSTVYPKV